MSNYWDTINLNEGEKIHHIDIPSQEANYTGNLLYVNRSYQFRCRCLGAVRALQIAYEYVLERLYHEEELTGNDKQISNLSKIPTNLSASCEDEGFGVLWLVRFDIIPYAQAMNDQDFDHYFNFSANSFSRESTTDANGVPIIHQYTYPANHPRYPSETIISTGTIQKDTAVFTFYRNLIKEMKYPEAAAGFISHVNELPWGGYPARTLKISSVSIRGRFTDPARDDIKKHYYTITFEIQANDIGWDQVSAIIDPDTGQYPGDVSLDGTIQSGNTYAPGRNVHVLPQFDFHRLWPNEDSTSFQDRGLYEFPLPE